MISVSIAANDADPRLEPGSATWRFVRIYLNDEISSLREKNDKLTLDAVSTAAIRGQIKMAKQILQLEQKRSGGDEARSKGLAADIFGAD
jgi:hypothetical protein